MRDQVLFELPQFSGILSFVDAIFAQLNLGLLIYYAEDLQDPAKLRLIYANEEASRSTGTDLGGRVGKYIGEAFPSLSETDLPKTFLEILNTKQPRVIGETEYEDQSMAKRRYSVRSFPMPADCVGVIFESLGAN